MKIFVATLLFTLGFNVLAVPVKFQGVDLRNDTVVSLDFTGKNYLVVYFLSSSCPCSQSHFDHLNDLEKKYKDFSFIGLNSNKNTSKENAKKYFNKFKIKFPILLDKKLEFANAYGALKTPHVFIVNKAGEIIFQGGATNSRNTKRATKFYLSNALEQLSNGKKLKIKNAKALGCYIQR